MTAEGYETVRQTVLINYKFEKDGAARIITRKQKTGKKVKQVSLGEYHSAAVTVDGCLYMWGGNGGRFGNGATKSSYVPIRIMDNVVSVSLSSDNSAAITTDGSLYMWGHNDWSAWQRHN